MFLVLTKVLRHHKTNNDTYTLPKCMFAHSCTKTSSVMEASAQNLAWQSMYINKLFYRDLCLCHVRESVKPIAYQMHAHCLAIGAP